MPDEVKGRRTNHQTEKLPEIPANSFGTLKSGDGSPEVLGRSIELLELRYFSMRDVESAMSRFIEPMRVLVRFKFDYRREQNRQAQP